VIETVKQFRNEVNQGAGSLLSYEIVTGVKTMRCLTMKFAIRGFQPRLRIMHPLREKAFRNHRQNHVSEDRK